MRKLASLRSTPSEELIAQALLHLMGRMPFRDVTVTTLCREASVSRQTFYRYYDTTIDALEQHLYNLSVGWTIENQPSPIDPQTNLRRLFDSLPYPKSLLKLLERDGLFPLLERVCCLAWPLITKAIKAQGSRRDENLGPYYDHFVSSTLVTILQIWTSRDFKESPDVLADLAIAELSGSWE